MKYRKEIIDRALENIDRERERCKRDYDRAIAKLDADERELLGLRPEANSSPKFNAMTREQQRHCEFMGFDPDNPDIPLD